jgi:hypothetical protein
MRNAVGVFVGYLIFALSAVLLFQLSGQKPHGVVSSQFMMLSIVYGMVFAALGGFVAERIAWRPSLKGGDGHVFKTAIALAVVIAVGAIVSVLTTPSTEARWSQWSAVILMAPSALIGGWLAARRPRH